MKRMMRLVSLSALSVISILVCAKSQPAFKGKFSSIPPRLQQQMQMRGNSWHQGCPVSLNQLSYLTVSYWGFDNKSHIGHIIINKQLAAEVVQIFEELYQHHFSDRKICNFLRSIIVPHVMMILMVLSVIKILRINLNFSMHAYGIAIDISPVYNPYEKIPGHAYPVKGQKVFG